MKMYMIQTELEISAAHKLTLSYDSPCSKLHGHNWKIIVAFKSPCLNSNGMIVDFASVKNILKARFDHIYLNDVLSCNPTAENIAFEIARFLNDESGLLERRKGARCCRVEVQETAGNLAVWQEDYDEPNV